MRRIPHGAAQAMQTQTVETRLRPVVPPDGSPLPSAPPHPAQDTLVDVLVHRVKLPVRGSRPKVLAPASKHGIELADQFVHVLHSAAPRVREHVDSASEALQRLLRRPSLHEMQVRRPLDAPRLADLASQKGEALRAPSQIDLPRLLRMQHEPEAPEDDPQTTV